MKNKKAMGTAIGKIILMGEHAVVYGEPAIAIPFPSTEIKTTIYEKEGPVYLNCFFYQGLLTNAPKSLNGLKIIIMKIIESFKEDLKNFSIDIESSIPPERGMGSSAAVAIATIRALYKYFGIPISHRELIKWSDISEKIIHGNPSGLDAAVIIGERGLYFVKGRPFIPFKFKLDAYLIVADTGEIGQTKEAVESVRRLVQANPEKGKAMIKELGDLTDKGKVLIEKNKPKEFGETMTKAHMILNALGVSNSTLNDLVNIAIDKGALGAKLTGGGRGGCMIALASTEKEAKLISENLLANGAINTWTSNLGADI